jgi:hypothetical protein
MLTSSRQCHLPEVYSNQSHAVRSLRSVRSQAQTEQTASKESSVGSRLGGRQPMRSRSRCAGHPPVWGGPTPRFTRVHTRHLVFAYHHILTRIVWTVTKNRPFEVLSASPRHPQSTAFHGLHPLFDVHRPRVRRRRVSQHGPLQDHYVCFKLRASIGKRQMVSR